MVCSAFFRYTPLHWVMAVILVFCVFNANCADQTADDSIEAKSTRYESLTCTKLRDLSDHIMERLQQTANKSYEGGNPEWINKNLPSYDVSELRFMDVFDGSCDRIPNPTNCHELYQQHETDMYNWFLNQQNSTKSIYDELFVEQLKLCCGKNQYGPNCDTCKVVSADGNVCDGKGECKGEYTRTGDGTCVCQNSYVGEKCESCAPHHFQEKNGECHSCHRACKKGCTDFSEKACLDNECSEGYEPIGDNAGCKKIDFCANATATNCAKDEYCVNLETKFECRKCDKSCIGCTGPSNKECYSCGPGYTVGNRACDKIKSMKSKYRFIKYQDDEKNIPPKKVKVDDAVSEVVDENQDKHVSKGDKKSKKSKKEKHSSGDDDEKAVDKKGKRSSKGSKQDKAGKKTKHHKKGGDKKKKYSKNKKSEKKQKSSKDILYEGLNVKPEPDDVFDEL